jgi:hypothetical protein
LILNAGSAGPDTAVLLPSALWVIGLNVRRESVPTADTT